MDAQADLGALRARCEEVLRRHQDDEQLGKALSGLYYSFKSLKFVPARTQALLAGPYEEVMNSNRADEACYYAEAMIRSLHPAGDLVAQVVNICALGSAHGRGDISLQTILKDARLDAELRKALAALSGSRDYDYVREFTNATKHREFIRRVILHDDNHQRIEFQPFNRRNGKAEGRRDFGELILGAMRLRDLVERVLRALVDPGLPAAALIRGTVTFGGSVTATVEPSAFGHGIRQQSSRVTEDSMPAADHVYLSDSTPGIAG